MRILWLSLYLFFKGVLWFRFFRRTDMLLEIYVDRNFQTSIARAGGRMMQVQGVVHSIVYSKEQKRFKLIADASRIKKEKKKWKWSFKKRGTQP